LHIILSTAYFYILPKLSKQNDDEHREYLKKKFTVNIKFELTLNLKYSENNLVGIS